MGPWILRSRCFARIWKTDLVRGSMARETGQAPSLQLVVFYFCQQLFEFLFPFGLIFTVQRFGVLGDVHGAKFWSAHGAEFCFFVEVVGQSLGVHGSCSFWI